MNTPLISRTSYRPASNQTFIADLTLARARTHEFCGPARRTLALMLAARMEGSIYWIRTAWEGDRLHAPGVTRFCDPSRVSFVEPQRLEDLLWSTEEVLRAGCVPLVVTELPKPPPLTPVRRLHLAAETGAQSDGAPISVLLTPESGGAQGVESRWHMAAKHTAKDQVWSLNRLRARMVPPQEFRVSWNGQRAHLEATCTTA
ncbi:MAG: hypothetical protein AAF198_07145 [Pseudomonadota bacterium]